MMMMMMMRVIDNERVEIPYDSTQIFKSSMQAAHTTKGKEKEENWNRNFNHHIISRVVYNS